MTGTTGSPLPHQAAPPPPTPAEEGPPGGHPPGEASIRLRLKELRGPQPSEDDELLAELLHSFIDGASDKFDLLHHAIDTGDTAQVEHLAHSLAGSAFNLGADTLGRLCQELEAHGRTGHPAIPQQQLQHARNELTAASHVMTALARELQPTTAHRPTDGA